MKPLRSVKKAQHFPCSVAVIASRADLPRALRLRRPPDFFELRLDCLTNHLDEVERLLPQLPAPFIITARSAREGGANHLSLAQRRALLLRFLPKAALLDLELSDAQALRDVRRQARRKKIPVIFSVHNFAATPSESELGDLARQVHSLGAAIFKIAARTNRMEEIERLVTFVKSRAVPLPISAMGIGRLGILSRRKLARAGSVLNYAYLERSLLRGQLSLAQLRAILPADSSRRASAMRIFKDE